MTQTPIQPDLQSAILCDDVRQERNGKFILIGLFDAIMIPQLPVRYPRLFMVTRWCSGEGEFFQRSRILKPDMSSTLVEGQKIPVRLPSPEATATNVEVFLNVEFHDAGTHWVEISLDNDLKIRYPLRVSIVQNPPGQGGIPPPGMF
ncbi:MAG TPA: hypothetical protein PKE26_08455 [Kiritimatiellia bacterium]|nr:hypothetical protein [Kiritimatiellia bacterium]HMO99125.1 hypothetical protein [Kiritimatiellia bacterium]HMP95697.1 hypothetical protein [Kiritimatiellia bacterium]